MTYKDRFVAEVKFNGKILRVLNDSVTLPFGSEYSLLLKNLNTRKARVNISIDGQDVLDGKSLILGPNETTELEGFLRGMQGRNRFKFIQKTQEISDHRGDRIDDGLIRVEFAYEKDAPLIKEIIHKYHYHHHDWYGPYFHHTYYNYSDTGNARGFSNDSNSIQSSFSSNPHDNLESENFRQVSESFQTPIDDMGITVKGSEINQQFSYGSIGPTEPPEVIVIKLRGTNDRGSAVQQPVTVQTKLTCSSCGRRWSSANKFCGNCGTYLE
jgi:hypothetical protein